MVARGVQLLALKAMNAEHAGVYRCLNFMIDHGVPPSDFEVGVEVTSLLRAKQIAPGVR
jgi:hypothetical protein